MTEFTLDGLRCANCAAKIEKELKGLPKIETVKLHFSTSTLKVDSEVEEEELTKEIARVVHTYEPEVEVVGKKSKGKPADREAITLLARLILSIILGAAAFLVPFDWAVLPLTVSAYLIAGYDVLYRAVRNIFTGDFFDEFFLMSAATIGAFLIGEYFEALGVMVFYQIGEYVQGIAVRRSRKSISSVLAGVPETVHVLKGNTAVDMQPEDVLPGTKVLVKPGERLPLDSTLSSESAVFNLAAVTGESEPVQFQRGDSIASGSVLLSSSAEFQVEKPYSESTLQRIAELVENASEVKAAPERFIHRFAKIYTPIVVFSAVFLALLPPLVFGLGSFSEWVHRALVFLVVSCPCALVLSVPLGYFAGIARSARSGVIVKGGRFLEALGRADNVVFDKTGTLTTGRFQVSSVNPAPGATEKELMELTAAGESHSTHPLAKAVLQAKGADFSHLQIEEFSETSGEGTESVVDGKPLYCGSAEFLKKRSIAVGETDSEHASVIHTAYDRRYIGAVYLSDTLKPESKKAVQELKKLGVQKVAMLTGDRKDRAEAFARELGIDTVYSQLLPEDKLKIMKEMSGESKGHTVFVGDGLNDAPVIAASDIGIAMGGIGSDLTVEAADIVLTNDNPGSLVEAWGISGKTARIVRENIGLAFAVKAGVLVLGAFGFVSLWAAVFADVGVALLAVLNSTRILGKKGFQRNNR
ncbi:MAG: heavy metal translocating P-type ATPase [Spirochaetia bacterium]